MATAVHHCRCAAAYRGGMVKRAVPHHFWGPEGSMFLEISRNDPAGIEPALRRRQG